LVRVQVNLDARGLVAGMTDLKFDMEVTSESKELIVEDNRLELILDLITKVTF
jgi:hypothetical protein